MNAARKKIENFCKTNVLPVHNFNSIYEVPKFLVDQGLLDRFNEKFKDVFIFSDEWESLRNLEGGRRTKIYVAGKYEGTDVYFSIFKAFTHASMSEEIQIEYIDEIVFVMVLSFQGDSGNGIPIKYWKSRDMAGKITYRHSESVKVSR